MVVDSIFAATRFGLEFERLRLEAASHNIAIANTANAPGHAARLMHVTAPYGADFDSAIGATGHSVPSEPVMVATDAIERQEHDPADPAADKNGMVSFPRVDMVDEMSTLMEASRAYEANVRAFNTLSGMALHALDIGGGS
ncbi:flagellar basal body rod C-terminal domain-containing protein [Rhodanobacter sp. A1T4]|jgi:flagellar basal-body rod protein FlgC|uniref:flagellar basal body rod protein FlgC n=1 Tax=Rhodanobacter sp. A1T4 TaxID=2723087 RepID=UPI00161B6ADF|nr:flagellar basal body rod C-terminal domain-containing protein [Rhodanobacter sp. A1T4]MBB6247599.1 flagellar basal-body rod protein FlgC [Rhodanobacter sp. A1T4]